MMTAKPQICARVCTKFELHRNFPLFKQMRPHSVFLLSKLISSSTINYTETLTEEITDMFVQEYDFNLLIFGRKNKCAYYLSH